MNKKGVAVNFMIMFELVVVVMVVGMSFFMAAKYSQEEDVQRLLYTKELALMVDALVGVPGDAFLQFPYDASRFTFILNKGEAVGSLLGEKNALQKDRESFHLPIDYHAQGLAEGTKDVCIKKEGKSIEFGPCVSLREETSIETGSEAWP